MPTYTTGSRTLRYDFGDLSNTDTNDATIEEVIIVYRTVVADNEIIAQNDMLINAVTMDRSD